jgi:predicted acyltransferase
LPIAVGLIVFNLYGLFTRSLLLNLFGTMALLAAGYYLVGRISTSFTSLWQKLFTAGACLLLLGLFFEAYEGGIRKDHSTFSYYFVTSGLAFMALLAFSVLSDYFRCRKSVSFLTMTGQNPMIAYVSSSLVVLPLLHLTHLLPWIDTFSANPWLGFLRGVLITALVALLTMFFTKIKWFWRT